MSKAVMQHALDALVQNHNWHVGRAAHGYEDSTLCETNMAVIAELRAELAKPDPEPVAWMMENADYPKIGRNLTFTPHDRWHPSWAAIPLYRKDDHERHSRKATHRSQ
jgi:hypothetical protein